jgi:hypothetical protein
MLYKIDGDNNKIIWDHYNPATKTLPPGYEVFLAIKGVVTAAPANRFKHTFYLDMQTGSSGPEVAKLQTALMELGYNIPSLTNNPAAKGYYGKETQQAVFEFQQECVAVDVWAWITVMFNKGRYCSSLTRTALNKFFA